MSDPIRQYEEGHTTTTLSLMVAASYAIIFFCLLRLVTLVEQENGINVTVALMGLTVTIFTLLHAFTLIQYLGELGKCRTSDEQAALRDRPGIKPKQIFFAAALLVVAEILPPSPLMHGLVLSITAVGVNVALASTVKLWATRFYPYKLA